MFDFTQPFLVPRLMWHNTTTCSIYFMHEYFTCTSHIYFTCIHIFHIFHTSPFGPSADVAWSYYLLHIYCLHTDIFHLHFTYISHIHLIQAFLVPRLMWRGPSICSICFMHTDTFHLHFTYISHISHACPSGPSTNMA